MNTVLPHEVQSGSIQIQNRLNLDGPNLHPYTEVYVLTPIPALRLVKKT